MRGFTRELRDWEKEEVARLVNLITNAYARKDDKDDDLRWMAENSGCFSVFSMYRLCENNIHPNDFGVIANMMWHNVFYSFIWSLGPYCFTLSLHFKFNFNLGHMVQISLIVSACTHQEIDTCLNNFRLERKDQIKTRLKV